MNELAIFNFEENEVRTQLIKEEPWFVAKDVCDVLGLSNSRQALARLDDDEKADEDGFSIIGVSPAKRAKRTLRTNSR